MRSYNKLLLTAGAVFIFILVATNVLFMLIETDENSRPYMVDINRAYDTIVQANDPLAAEASAFDNLSAISYLPGSATEDEREAFFSGQSNSVIRLFGDGYLRFDYLIAGNEDFARAWMLANCAIIVVGALSIGMLLFIKKRLVQPFTQLSDLPYQLSKGHLTTGLKENKSRYFGKFIWGLDMLRETLEARKRNEINLTRENKTMVLSLSHDIKTPLSAIRLYAKALSEDLYDTDEKRREIAGNIDRKAGEIEGFVRDIIKTSKEDFLHIEVSNGEFYLSELIASVCGYYEEKLTLIKCSLIVEDYQDRLLFGDLERYVEVIENIIENAIKYGDGREIRIAFPLEEGVQGIAISNTGNALPEGELVHIWESFWRGSNAGSQEGSGLGLYICRQLMRAMKGEIYATINAGHMVFTLIPLEA